MIKHVRNWARPLLFAAFLFASMFSVSISNAPQVSAAGPPLLESTDLYKQLSTHQHYWMLYSCFINADIDNIPESEMGAWDFFEGDDQVVGLGSMYGSDAATVHCSTESVIKTAFGYLGETDPVKAFCQIKGAQYDGSSTTCDAAHGSKDWDNNESNSERAKSFKSIWGSKDPGLNTASTYLRAYKSLVSGCGGTFVSDTLYDTAPAAEGAGGKDDDKEVVGVVVAKDGGSYDVKYAIMKVSPDTNPRNPLGTIPIVANSEIGPIGSSNRHITSDTCTNLAKQTVDNVRGYQAYIAANGYDNTTDTDQNTSGSTEPVCEVSGFGWVICPLINLMQEATDTVAGFLDDYLQLEPLTTSTTSTLYKGWSNMLGIANILLIFAFLFLIFSQATSVGISNYGIKKMLPRIIAAAILINLSYYICAVMVDISNIVGSGVADLIYNNLGSIADTNNSSGLVGGLRKLSDAALSGIFAVSGIVVVLFFFLVPAVIAMLTIFVVVAARSAIITLLIIIAPIAFAAWVLPNTEKYFRKWWGLFVQMLVVYPAIMALFAAASAAANIVISSSGASPTDNPGPGNFFPLLIGLIIQALPLLALPALIKLSSGALGRIENMTRSGLKKYGGDKSDGFVKDRLGAYKNMAQAAAAERFQKGYTGSSRKRTVGGRALGTWGRAPMRKALWEERKANTDQAYKTLLEEQRGSLRGGTATHERGVDLKERMEEAEGTHKLHYENSRAFGAAANERGARAVRLETQKQQLGNADETKKRAFRDEAITNPGGAASEAVLEGKTLGVEGKAQEQALDKRFKRERNAGSTPQGVRAATAEAQSRTNEVQLGNLDDDFQLVYEQDRNANPGGAASRAARRQKVVKKNLETTTTDFDAAFDRDAAIALETNTGPAIAQAAAAAIAAANTSKATAEGAAADLKAVYDSGTAAAISGATAPAWATAAAVAAAAKTASTTRSASQETRVKGSLKREAAANPTGALGLAEQESIRVNKDLGNAEGDIKAQYDESVVANPAGVEADLAREEIAVKERQENAANEFSTEFDEERIAALRSGTGPQYALDAADRLETKEDLSERKSNVDLEGKTIRAETAATDTASTAAQNAARKFQLDQRNVGATAQQNLNIAGRVETDAAFTAEAAGIRGQRDEARIRGLATQTVVKDKAQEVEIHTDMLNRNGALLAKEGISYDSATGEFIDLKAGGATITESDAAVRIGLPAGTPIDVTTRAAAKYAGDNQLMTSDAGARSVAAMLAKTGALDSTHVQSIIADLTAAQLAEARLTNPAATEADIAESIGFTVDYINSQASAAGMKHLSYNNVKSDGTLEIGGMFGGLNGAANRVLSEGVSKITKEMYSDAQFGPILAQKIHDLETTQPDSFDAELTHMSPRQIEFLVKAQIAAGIIGVPTTDSSGAPLDAAAQRAARDAAQKAAVDSYTTRQSTAKERFGSTG